MPHSLDLKNAIVSAMEDGDEERFGQCLSAGKPLDYFNLRLSLLEATRFPNVHFLRTLLDTYEHTYIHGKSPAFYGELLAECCKHKNSGCAQMMIDRNADVEVNSNFPLRTALVHNAKSCIDLVLPLSNPNRFTEEIVTLAINNNQQDVWECLIASDNAQWSKAFVLRAAMAAQRWGLFEMVLNIGKPVVPSQWAKVLEDAAQARNADALLAVLPHCGQEAVQLAQVGLRRLYEYDSAHFLNQYAQQHATDLATRQMLEQAIGISHSGTRKSKM